MAKSALLDRYVQKRDFRVTPEPRGSRPHVGKAPLYVIQKHHASHLHYDFRLELDGVLKSWAVPKGPSTDPQVKRLAMEVEDHPIDYAGFEGVIPQGEYGGGNVIVWDRGTYSNISADHGKPITLQEGLKKGHISIRLEGKKLRGGWTLVRTRPGPKPSWLLMKMNDAEANHPENPVAELPESVISGKRVEEMNGKSQVWHSHRAATAGNVRLPFKLKAPIKAAPAPVKKSKAAQPIKIGDKSIPVSNLDKVLYPETGFTKGEVLNYYAQVAPFMVPHLQGRPLTMKRYPGGVNEEFFYEKQAPKYRPKWMRTFAMHDEKSGRTTEYLIVDDLPGLIWVANLASLELHTLLARAPKVDQPTFIAFDLDPGPGMGVLDCCKVALELRDMLSTWKLQSFVKTSGSKGLHLYIPLNSAVDYDATKTFAHSVALLMERQNPKGIVSNMSKALRNHKIFIDWSQNSRHKTTVTAYSLRARSSPTVSTPVAWKEIEKAVKTKSAGKLVFETDDVLKRLKSQGDLFGPVQTLKQKLPRIQGLT
jgi:bifunctional non-homologous end joining protein LigD